MAATTADVGRVKEIYEAFGRGDVPAIQELVTDDIVFYDPGPPEVTHAGTYRGRDGVAEFFRLLAESQEFESFEPLEFYAGGERVVVLGRLRATVRATGVTYDNEWAMVFTFRDGLVSRFQVYEDTARELAAHVARQS